MDQGTRLRMEFAARQRSAMRGAGFRQVRRAFSGIVAGVIAALVPIVITVFVTRIDFYWHSFLLELSLAGLVGLVLQRAGGGLLKGVLALPGAYGGAYLLRKFDIDPAHWLAPEAAAVVIDGYGHLLAVCCMVGCGGVLGYVLELRNT